MSRRRRPRFQPEMTLDCLYHDEDVRGLLAISTTSYFCNPVHVFEALVMIDGGERSGETLKEVCLTRTLSYEPDGDESPRQRVARLQREAIVAHNNFSTRMVEEYRELASVDRSTLPTEAELLLAEEKAALKADLLEDTVLRYLTSQPKGAIAPAWVRELAEATGLVDKGVIVLDADGHIRSLRLGAKG